VRNLVLVVPNEMAVFNHRAASNRDEGGTVINATQDQRSEWVARSHPVETVEVKGGNVGWTVFDQLPELGPSEQGGTPGAGPLQDSLRA
jgi:hypothetical protein